LSPDRRGRLPLLARALLAGAALATLGFAAAVLLLSGGGAPLVALLLTLLASLAVGLWAGAPEPDGAIAAPRAAWFGAGIAAGIAGAYATAWSVSAVVQTSIVGRIAALVLIAGVPIYALGLLLPALLAEAETREEEEARDETEGMSNGWGPLGTIVVGALAGVALGSALAALVLLPRFGAGPVLLGIAALLIVPTLLPEPRPEARTLERTLYRGESAFSSLAVVEVVYPEQRQPELRLYVNAEEQSGELERSGAPTLAYVAAAEQWLAQVAPRGARYLFLGGGAYTLPRRVAERDPGARITVVELDPEVTRLAGRFFGLRPQHRIASLHGDARAWAERLVRESGGEGDFDVVYLDVYDGREALPYALITREAIELYRRLLRPGGWLAANVIGTTHGPETRRFWSTVRTTADVFPTVALYPHLGADFPGRQNVLLVTNAAPDAATPARAGRFELWPHAEWPRVEGTAVYRDVLGGAGAAERRAADAPTSGGAPSAAPSGSAGSSSAPA
jgi:spermidine synthase